MSNPRKTTGIALWMGYVKRVPPQNWPIRPAYWSVMRPNTISAHELEGGQLPLMYECERAWTRYEAENLLREAYGLPRLHRNPQKAIDSRVRKVPGVPLTWGGIRRNPDYPRGGRGKWMVVHPYHQSITDQKAGKPRAYWAVLWTSTRREATVLLRTRFGIPPVPREK